MKRDKDAYKLRKANSYSYSITIPKKMVEKYGWREKQKLSVRDKGHGKIEISDWRRK